MKQILKLFFPVLLISHIAIAQQSVEGTISNAEGEPLVGATLHIRGNKATAVTDINGAFKITAPEKLPFTLVVKSMGFKTQEIQV